MEPWQVIGTVAAILFGAIGAWVTVTKLVWDRRDRLSQRAKEAEEADRRAHEGERRRREEAEWQAADREKEGDREFRVYSEAEARRFINEHPPAVSAPLTHLRRRSAATALVIGALIVGIAVGIAMWLSSR